MHGWNLFKCVRDTAQRHPERPALEFPSESLTYEQLIERAFALGSRLSEESHVTGHAVGLLSEREPGAFSSILAIACANAAYVPLSPRLPPSRIASVVTTVGIRTVIVTASGLQFRGLAQLQHLGVRLIGLTDDVSECLSDFDHVTGAPPAPPRTYNDVAYVLSTSGSTGVPKAIAITNESVRSYLHWARDTLGVGPSDRCSNLFELEFDLSVHDLFVTWDAGATVVPGGLGGGLGLDPTYIRDRDLTVWFSVPSVAALLDRFQVLHEGAFPGLRLSLFCGEPLLLNTLTAWTRAACQSRIVNLYGPTEATIAITWFEAIGASPRTGAELGNCERRAIVCLGSVFPRHEVRVVDADWRDVAFEHPGELWLSGPQVAGGYVGDEERTTASFVLDDSGKRWYRTGDICERSHDGVLWYRGRVDNQVKVAGGYRVELEEVESVLRRALPEVPVAAVAVSTEGVLPVIYAVVACEDDQAIARARAASHAELPWYMTPRDVLLVEALPQTDRGKLDRAKLTEDVRVWLSSRRELGPGTPGMGLVGTDG